MRSTFEQISFTLGEMISLSQRRFFRLEGVSTAL